MVRVVAGVLGALLLSLAASQAGAAQPLSFTHIGDSGTVDFDGYVPRTTTVDPRITSALTLKLINIDNHGYDWSFAYTATNTSLTAMRLAEAAWNLGFTDGAQLLGVGASPFGPFPDTASGQLQPLGERDLCLNTGGVECNGLASGGLTDPGSDGDHTGSGAFKLRFIQNDCAPRGGPCHTLPAPTEVHFDDFAVRYFTIATGSPSAGTGALRASAAPEPAAWTLAVLGFAALGAALRRRGQPDARIA